MSGVSAHFFTWAHTRQGKKIIRYSATSVVTTAFSALILAVVFGVFRVWTEIPSTVFANVCAAVPSYFMNRHWAWGKNGTHHVLKEVLPFWILSASSITFSILCAAVAKDLGRAIALGHFDQTLLALAFNVLSFGIFWVLKLLTFNRIFRVPGLLAGIDEHLDEEETAELAAIVSKSASNGDRHERRIALR